MKGILLSFVILLACGLLIFLGLKMNGKEKSKKGKLVFACLVVWATYMALAKQYQLNPLNTVTLRTVMLSPVGQFVERYIFQMPGGE